MRRKESRRKSRSTKPLLFIVNVDWFFESHRLPIAIEAIKRGYEVHLACLTTGREKYISNLGIVIHNVALSRSGTKLFSEVLSIVRIAMILVVTRPRIVHLVSIKPVLYGGLLCRALRVRRTVASISGLGSVFSSQSVSLQLAKRLSLMMYKAVLKNPRLTTIFQNENDKKALVDLTGSDKHDWHLIKGSGVDLSIFEMISPSLNPIIFVFASRLIREKGVAEFVEAAQIIVKRGYGDKVMFWIAGAIDLGNPNAVAESDIARWQKSGCVEFLGQRRDIPSLFGRASVVVLPSYYGEGLPKVLIEAAAAGRPAITTDHPGCRDAIRNKLTGVLVPVRDSTALADAMEQFIEHPTNIVRFGIAARKMALDEYSIGNVVRKHLEIYRE